ncbi:MAG: orotidine-5'-phosphate decarboxylase [Cytophagales bacterium]|nr:orotidine-5'-phosphate decarboxylase [Cytophagales bacterium]
MTQTQLFSQIKKKRSYLCIGLDTDINKIPSHLLSTTDPVFEFNKQIIDATSKYCVAYKLNTAFYESAGSKGWEILQKTLEYIPKDFFTIADAKRGDIGNSSKLYARAFFDPGYSGMNFDAVTVAPYMGEDSVKPFLEYDNKWVILLALTSNPGSNDFQMLKIVRDGKEKYLFENVIETSQKWGSASQIMYVVGATQTDMLPKIREIAPDHFLLIPGIGAQGGDSQQNRDKFEKISKLAMNKQCGLLVNASRSIIYASGDKDFAKSAGQAAHQLQQQMAGHLDVAQLSS